MWASIWTLAMDTAMLGVGPPLMEIGVPARRKAGLWLSYRRTEAQPAPRERFELSLESLGYK